jgi:CheY-like chemotaxis protein
MANIAKDQVSSPLTAILGQTEVLKSRLNIKNPAVKESLRSIEEQVTKVKNLLEHLHDFAHIQDGGKASVPKRKVRTRKYKTEKTPASAVAGKRKILVVDDEPAMCQVLEDFFTMNSFDVVTSLDGEEGLKEFNKGNVDLVVTDLTMPRMDGVDLLREIKNSESSVPVILMTGLNLNQIDGIAKKYGADGYIMKPFSFFRMMKLVQDLLSRNSVLSVS